MQNTINLNPQAAPALAQDGHSNLAIELGLEVRAAAMQTGRTFVSALRLTIAAMLFVVASFISLGANVSVAVAKTAAKGKNAKVIKTTKAKAKMTLAKAKVVKAKATGKKTTRAKAIAAKKMKSKKLVAKRTSASMRARTKAAILASKARTSTRTAARKVSKSLGGNFALLDQYRRDLQTYGVKKLEGWQKNMEGEASWYGTFFHGRLTASGKRFNKFANVAAHRSLPFGSILKVTNKENGKSVIVEVLDRGPYVHDRLIDLSQGAAQTLGFRDNGTASVATEILQVGTLKYEAEKPLTAAELRGDVIRHTFDLASFEKNAQDNVATKGNSRFASMLNILSNGSLLPEMKLDRDAFAPVAAVVNETLRFALVTPRVATHNA